MSFLRKAVKGGLAVKAMQILQREAAKPQNQRKARELLNKLTKSSSTTKQTRRGRRR